MREQEAIEFFNTPKKVYKMLDKIFDKEKVNFFIGRSKEDYTIINEKFEEISSASSVYKCFVAYLHGSYGVGKEDCLPAWTLTKEIIEQEQENVLSQIDDSVGNISALDRIIDQGGLINYNSANGKSSFAVNMPEKYGFVENLVVNDVSFSDGVSQLNSVLSTMIKMENPEQ